MMQVARQSGNLPARKSEGNAVVRGLGERGELAF